jgi:hypothetical protein
VLATLVWEPRHVLGALLFPPVLFLILRYYPAFSAPPGDRIQWASGTLQLLGTVVVLVGLFDRRRLFAENDVPQLLERWLERAIGLFMPKPPPKVINLSGRAIATSTGRASATVSLQKTTVEERLDFLEQGIRQLRADAAERERRLQSEISTVHAKLAEQLSQQQLSLRETANRVKDVAVGSLGVELMGLGWLCYGTLLDTWPGLALFMSR